MSSTDEPVRDGATVEEALAPAALDANVLVVGPTLSRKDELAFDILADRWTGDRPPFAITATDTAAQFRDRIAPFAPSGERAEDVYVVDCLEATGTDSGDAHTCPVGSPADLTGIGICLSKGYDHYGTPGGRRVLVDNLATLLIYSEIDRVYRFVSSINSRITGLGDATVQLLDADAVEEATRHKLFGLFSTVVEVRREAGATVFRAQGTTTTDWHEYRPRGGPR